VIVGGGPLRQDLESQAVDLGVADIVRFEGHYDNVHELYAEFDLFALSSDTEQMPLVILEAMAAGLPIVATDVGDLSRMVAPSNLPWLSAPSHEAFSRALSEAIAAPETRASVGADNFRRVRENYDAQGMFETWDRLFAGRGLS
jgi:glycosyltransferase involved in cell wall biosynthesis